MLIDSTHMHFTFLIAKGKVSYQFKFYTTSKLIWSTIQIVTLPHLTLTVLVFVLCITCGLARTIFKNMQHACTHDQPSLLYHNAKDLR